MPFISVDDSVSQSYNYVLVGLTLAARLSEDPSVSVIVLEAGGFNPEDQLISRPVQFGAHLGQDAYAWTFKTVPQENVAGRQIGWDRQVPCFLQPIPVTYRPLIRGKVLGGSSAINFSVWTNPAKGDIDDWEKLGNTGLELGKLQQISLESNLLERRGSLETWNLPKNGSLFLSNGTGVMLITTNRLRSPSIIVDAMALVNLGVPKAPLPLDGDPQDKEVILSVGALKTPHLLELSGIGRPDVLKQAGITPRLDLPVGENVQEHVFASLSYELKDGVADDTLDVLGDEVERQKHIDLHARGEGVFSMGIVNFAFLPLSTLSPNSDAIYSATINSIKEKIDQGRYSVGATETLKMQIQKVERNALDCEITTLPGFLSGPNPPRPGRKHFNIFCMNNSLFSRGTAHLTSSDPLVDPAYDPCYFEDKADLGALIETVKFARKVCRTSPFKDVLDEEPVEVNPGPNVQTNEEIGAWIKQVLTSTWHTVGTASMLPRDKGGVVDSKLKRSHTELPEQAADIIKGLI
ncbi:uncharacterized protein EV420DRAFT_1687599 [Desarmillaria tabescens]|uniref:Glucose-methanol-choline oxidoreductase N-terminal domain-containing protein n=1 Tax=Armillaria tabescens TaxID=1929756 RepID=A0AA39KBJ4_ARMTA|nr:uncharacterized protein EV420DRAFT_1687599 [Desarmillaria tabescens]KAK0457793.1 hypothetical protein EV420DRAFT_1687599 [Desarmillaria tabescens]